MTDIKERIIVVRNPVSSHASDVQRMVMSPLVDHFPRHQVSELWTPSADWGETVDAIAEALQPGDTALVAAGDGTGSAAVNAYIQANIEGVKLGFLPYGNFHDMASTFTDRAAQKNPVRLLQSQTGHMEAYPIDVRKNGEHLRYSVLYATLGWTATVASHFDQPGVRRGLQSGRANLTTNLVDIAKMYFKTRGISTLPDFYRNEQEMPQQKTTDILAINGPIMAQVIRSQVPYYAGHDFLSKDLDVSGVLRNIGFLGKSGLNFMFDAKLRLPSTCVSSDRLRFDDASVPIQIDGEYMSLTDVSELMLAKDASTPRITILKTS